MIHYKEDLVQLVDRAAAGEKPPKTKIPRRYIPCFIRWPIKCLLLPFIYLDLIMQKLAKKIIRPPYRQTGGCKKRGACCHYILMIKFPPPLSWIFHFWHTQINGFYRRSKRIYYSNSKPVIVYGCRYLNKDGSCKNYRFRPMICRKYPNIESFSEPHIMKGCGFAAEPRK